MRVQGSLSFLSTTGRRARMLVRGNPLFPIPMDIAIRQCLAIYTSLRRRNRPFRRSCIVTGTRMKGEWHILWTGLTQTKKELNRHFLRNGITFLSDQSFVVVHGMRGSSHLIQVGKSFSPYTLRWDHGRFQGDYSPYESEERLTQANGEHSHTRSAGHFSGTFPDEWNTSDPMYNFEE